MHRKAIIRIDEDHPIHNTPWHEVRPGVFERRFKNVLLRKRACQDCKTENPIEVIVKDSVWEDARLFNGIICPGCLEKRLGRTLTVEDLKDCGWKREILYWHNKFSGKTLATQMWYFSVSLKTRVRGATAHASKTCLAFSNSSCVAVPMNEEPTRKCRICCKKEA